MSRLGKIRDEDGFSLVELLVAMMMGTVILLGTFAIVQAATRSSNRTTSRVVANQAARPVLSRIIDELHSSCISPDLAPILAGSSDSSISFIYSSDGGVTPVPTKKTISLTSGTLNEASYAYSSGSVPTWTFNATPTNYQLQTNVGSGTIVGATVPLFQYFAYDNTGAVSSSALATPLSVSDAASVAAVTVTFSIQARKTSVNGDAGGAVTVSDSALLRFSPATTAVGENTPCS